MYLQNVHIYKTGSIGQSNLILKSLKNGKAFRRQFRKQNTASMTDPKILETYIHLFKNQIQGFCSKVCLNTRQDDKNVINLIFWWCLWTEMAISISVNSYHSLNGQPRASFHVRRLPYTRRGVSGEIEPLTGRNRDGLVPPNSISQTIFSIARILWMESHQEYELMSWVRRV